MQINLKHIHFNDFKHNGSPGYLPLGIPYSLSKYHGTTGKYPARGEIPCLNSL
jgi:hypothetical protein